MSPKPETPDDQWRMALIEGHRRQRVARALFRRIPSEPRCKICQNPFGGLGGRVFAAIGFRRSQKNPALCVRCCEALPAGGLEIDAGILFGDIRGSTALGESMGSEDYAALLNRFYRVSTRVLVEHNAVIDKLIGDEVMAIFVPGMSGDDYRRKAVDAAVALARAVKDESADGAWLPLGVGVHVGPAYVGNVGGEVVDFTALGDTVNTAARLQRHAQAGQVVVSAAAFESAAEGPARGSLSDATPVDLSLDGKADPFPAHVVTV